MGSQSPLRLLALLFLAALPIAKLQAQVLEFESGGLKYKALLSGNVDVAVAFGTDGQIDADHLVVLVDDRHFFPPYAVAPVVRTAALAAYPGSAAALNAVAPLLTDTVMRQLNNRVDGLRQEPADVARDFLTNAKLL